ncbi:hypothetical protein [Thalassotalea agarivorans]|uniref:Protein-disulfide isomerase, contains CxxC motif n=1 Tax=Thalassotalea agarivorans TaxID=349064 RepID=A0A1I0DMK8_THASX|nr:hypothetical protein [Thalassotalea agarivorans]SET33424.1 protein-disulfide isomerase, contains CxxC motif [Thalassotalea agarivorans]
MQTSLFFIYDSHCPWSYVSTALVNQVHAAFPKMPLYLLHDAHFDGEDMMTTQQIDNVEKDSDLTFTAQYKESLSEYRDSTLIANLMAWASNKQPQHALALLNALQKAHFEQGNPLTSADDVMAICEQLKLSPPKKALAFDKLSKDAESVLFDIDEFREIIGTNAIPALMLAVNDNLILLNHNLYLKQPSAIVDAVKLEIKE